MKLVKFDTKNLLKVQIAFHCETVESSLNTEQILDFNLNVISDTYSF